MMDYSLIGLIKNPKEQGEWAAESALKILNGISPRDIPITMNKKGSIIINAKMRTYLDKKFHPDIIKRTDKVYYKE